MAARNNNFLIIAGILILIVIVLLAPVLFGNLLVFWVAMAAAIAFILFILVSFHNRIQQYENKMIKGKSPLDALINSM